MALIALPDFYERDNKRRSNLGMVTSFKIGEKSLNSIKLYGMYKNEYYRFDSVLFFSFRYDVIKRRSHPGMGQPQHGGYDGHFNTVPSFGDMIGEWMG